MPLGGFMELLESSWGPLGVLLGPRRRRPLARGQCAAGVRREPVDAPVDDKQLLIVGGCDLLLLSAGTVAARGFRARPSLAILAAVAVYVVFLVLVMRILQTSPL
ncbi:unnamed protein product [Prorocentrum cordatum]|uniref:Uncharacterized protein n=1 Tax=Prorocentrum cordatum TaxID=2364126 RepID=A0ABN9Y8J5_9DINO|nr:unnamed protein product [Polarella glacialis]